MIIGAPPLQMGQKLWRLLRGGPGATSQRSYAMADRQIDSLNERRVEPSRKAQSQQGGRESGLCPQAHDGCNPNQLASPVAFFYLTVDQVLRHLPPKHVAPSASHLAPVSKMGRECIKVQV